MNKKAKKILQIADVEKLPSLPHILLQFLDACHDKNLSFTELASILKQDPGLFARIYSAIHCNQPVNLQTASEDSIEQALQQLGINTIKNIAVTASVQQFFSHTSLEHTAFLKQHWYNSLHCAIVAESIARLYNYSNPDEAYTTGLLHNIGQLVIETCYPKKYTNAFAQLSEDEIFHSLEQDAFGTTHQQIGALLLKEHGANSFICDAVLYHHEKFDLILDAHPLVKIVNLSNILTSSYFEEDRHAPEGQQVFDAAEELLGLNKAELLQILENSQERIANISQELEINMIVDGMDGKTTKQQYDSDELKQAQLTEQIKNIALLDGIHQQLSRSGDRDDGTNELLNIISQNIAILFGVNHSILFLYDESSNRVNAVSAENQPPQLADISIPLISGRSLVTEALLKQETYHSFYTESFEHNLQTRHSIVDQQLIGITQQEGIICLPMIIDNAAIGTLILGVEQTQYETLWKQLTLLTRFADEVAHAIHAKILTGEPSANDKQKTSQLEQKIHEVLHEVRNPLSIMNNYLGILSYKLENDKNAQEDV